ncbi:MAG: hypothetical protein Ct9H300mP28_10510 [Pseudomonadota bacterium]|nr:MAG: hypothetical protein Ct9H300mP28_10510 [Pseudomonadota bacterium]
MIVKLRDFTPRVIEGEKQLEDLRYQNNTAQSRIESLQQIQSHYEGFKDSVKIFMQLMHENPDKKKQFGVSGLLADYISVSSEELEMVSQVMAEVLDWVVIERAEILPQIESFCVDNRLDNFNSGTGPSGICFKSHGENSGVPLSNILKIEEPLQEWATKFFSRFYLLDDDTKFWNEFGKNWPDAPIEMLSSSGIRMSNASVSMGTVQSGSLGFLQRQQEISMLKNMLLN